MTERKTQTGARWLKWYTIIYLCFIYLPVLFLPLFSFNDGIYVAFPMNGLTLHWWQEMINQPGMIHALWNSFQIGRASCRERV